VGVCICGGCEYVLGVSMWWVCEFCNVWVCVGGGCVSFVMCGCEYVVGV
jgi:hypothetical protein